MNFFDLFGEEKEERREKHEQHERHEQEEREERRERHEQKEEQRPAPGMGQVPQLPAQLALAMAYVPLQKWERTYEPQAAMERGTLFPELDLPFLGKAGVHK